MRKNSTSETGQQQRNDKLLFVDSEVQRAVAYRSAADAFDEPRGRVVRCTPWRWTVCLDASGETWFVKHRTGPRAVADARREFDWLRELGEAGIEVPEPVFLAEQVGRSALATRAIPGRPLDALLAWRGRDLTWFVETLAPVVCRLHAKGVFHRDLYLNHFIVKPDGGVALLDVERALRPRWRRARWRRKDLAGLWSSWPDAAPRPSAAWCLRFFRVARGGALRHGWKREVRLILKRADRVRARLPKFG